MQYMGIGPSEAPSKMRGLAEAGECLRTRTASKPGMQDEKGRLIYAYDGGLFLVTKPIDGKSATHANGGTISGGRPLEVRLLMNGRGGQVPAS